MKRAPNFLTKATQKWVNELLETYEFEDRHVRVLVLAGQAWDRAEKIRALLRRSGYMTKDRYNTAKAHPLLAEERAQARLFASLIRELGLDLADTEAPRVSRAQPKNVKGMWNATPQAQTNQQAN